MPGTQYTENDIETLDEWNAVLATAGCCCEMPEHAAPTFERESTSYSFMRLCGYRIFPTTTILGESMEDVLDDYVYFLRQTDTFEVDHTHTAGGTAENYIRTDIRTFGYDSTTRGCVFTDNDSESGSYYCVYGGDETETEVAGGESGITVTKTTTKPQAAIDHPGHEYNEVRSLAYSQPITDQLAYLVDQAEDAFSDDGWDDDATATQLGSIQSQLELDVGTTAKPRQVDWSANRYRVMLPDGDFEYYKAEWDEVFFGDDSTESLVAAREWEWTGGVDEFSPWFELMPPDDFGVVEIRNFRVISYRSPWGDRPTFVGDRWTAAT